MLFKLTQNTSCISYNVAIILRLFYYTLHPDHTHLTAA